MESRNIMVGTHRTSMRLEPTMWEALEDITTREGLTINGICTMIKERLEVQSRLRGDDGGEVTLTSAVRVFIAAYFRRASTEEGHARAGHGMSDPFRGTPFECQSLDGADENLTDEGAALALAAVPDSQPAAGHPASQPELVG